MFRYLLLLFISFFLSGCFVTSETSLAPANKAVSLPNSDRYREGFEISAKSSDFHLNGSRYFLRRASGNTVQFWMWNRKENEWAELHKAKMYFSQDDKFLIAEFLLNGTYNYYALFPIDRGYLFVSSSFAATSSSTWASLTNTFVSLRNKGNGKIAELSARRPDHALTGNPIFDFNSDRTVVGLGVNLAPTDDDVRTALSKRLRDGSMGLSVGVGADIGTVKVDNCKAMVDHSFICYYKASIKGGSEVHPLLGAMLSLSNLEGYKYASFKKGANGWYIERIYSNCVFSPDGKVNCTYPK